MSAQPVDNWRLRPSFRRSNVWQVRPARRHAHVCTPLIPNRCRACSVGARARTCAGFEHAGLARTSGHADHSVSRRGRDGPVGTRRRAGSRRQARPAVRGRQPRWRRRQYRGDGRRQGLSRRLYHSDGGCGLARIEQVHVQQHAIRSGDRTHPDRDPLQAAAYLCRQRQGRGQDPQGAGRLRQVQSRKAERRRTRCRHHRAHHPGSVHGRDRREDDGGAISLGAPNAHRSGRRPTRRRLHFGDVPRPSRPGRTIACACGDQRHPHAAIARCSHGGAGRLPRLRSHRLVCVGRAHRDAGRHHCQDQCRRQRLHSQREGQGGIEQARLAAGRGTPEETKAFIAAEVRKWAPIIKAAKIQM